MKHAAEFGLRWTVRCVDDECRAFMENIKETANLDGLRLVRLRQHFVDLN
jgi:hypothetical protein